MTTPFFAAVWKQLQKIPAGRVSTYGAIAKSLGKPGASRAVGNACHANPFSPRVPCHRIVTANGKLGGFAHGSRAKVKLLQQEGIQVKKGQIQEFEQKYWRF